MNLHEAISTYEQHRPELELAGVHMPDVRAYIPDGWKHNWQAALAEDALPTLTTDPSGGVPAMLTTLIDPEVFRILFAPTKAADILGEVQRGTWLDDAILFPVVEITGEVSSYGDYNNNGRTGINMNWPNRQSYLFQTFIEYGEREMERAALARINYASELNKGAAANLTRFSNFTYFFGVAGLESYGLLNDPNLGALLTPVLKQYGGTAWYSSGQVRASANEIFRDIQDLYTQLVTQTSGLVDQETPMVLAMSPTSEAALMTTNAFNVNVRDILKKNLPNLKIVTAVQYGALTVQNIQGVAAGNMMQLMALEIDGQKTGFAAYNEKMRQHPLIRRESSFRQKVTAGTWGTVIRMPVAVAGMVGI